MNNEDKIIPTSYTMPEDNKGKKGIKWWQKKEIWAGIIFITGGIKYFTKSYTVAHQLSDYTLTVGIPLALGVLGIKDGAANKSLPSGLNKIINAVKKK